MTNWIKDCTRRLSEDDVAIWKKGEEIFSKLIGVKYASKFERDGENVTLFYEEEEGKLVHDTIRFLLKEKDWFDILCHDFFNAIDDKHKAQARMMPFLIVADEIDNYQYMASEYIKRRLMRIRTSTHEESYK